MRTVLTDVELPIYRRNEVEADCRDDLLRTYVYSYPHKSLYRPFHEAVRLDELWQREVVREASLYVHLPFCEMRCGFCNLFTSSQPRESVIQQYTDTLERQMEVVGRATRGISCTDLYLGGGTPTILSPSQLTRLFNSLALHFPQRGGEFSIGIETSPATATEERIRVLADHGVNRVSVGVQTFDPFGQRALGRPQSVEQVHEALRTIREFEFPILNIDLIYGYAGQTETVWKQTLEETLAYSPDELYLYPLYVRPGTGLGNRGDFVEPAFHLFKVARDLLQARGYEQKSLRCFSKVHGSREFQDRNMIGLGCGARSYTSTLHYSDRFAVRQRDIQAIIAQWIQRGSETFESAYYGVRLSTAEQFRRRFLLALLDGDGLLVEDLNRQIPDSIRSAMQELTEYGLASWLDDHSRFRLTPQGLMKSDIIGPLFFSDEAKRALREFESCV